MTTLEMPLEATIAAGAGELIEMQMRVARRADELARRFGASRDSDRRLWLRAELEMFELSENARVCLE